MFGKKGTILIKSLFHSVFIFYSMVVLIVCKTTFAQGFFENGITQRSQLDPIKNAVSEVTTRNNFGSFENVLNNEDFFQKQNLSDLENSINPDEYYIGGGDILAISVIGLPAIHFLETIDQRGDLFIPELGLLQLGKITLTEAQRKISEFIQEKLKKKNQIYIKFIKAKTVSITINGAVQEPGTYILSGGERVLDAIRKANGGILPSLNDCNFREIICKNRDSIIKMDMFDYLLKNDVSGNPYIYPGDNFSLLYATKKVLLNSTTKSGISGWIPIKDNETLGSFLTYHRLAFSVDTTIIYYQSLGENANRLNKTFSWTDAGTIVLHDMDVITIPEKKNYSQVFMVRVGGEVARPGTYSIVRNVTKVEDIISNAGGPTALANLDRAVIIRNLKVDQSQKSRKSEISPRKNDIRPEMNAGMEKMANMSDFSILNISKYGSSLKLQEDDLVFIPSKEAFVYISGCVKRPGAYPYVAGDKLNNYINSAGGYTSKASRTNAFGMRYFENVSQQTDLKEIIEGDIIIIPESQEGKTLTTVVFPVVNIILGSIGMALTIISIVTR